jgi:cell wall-associated NlpC family hydrolase
LVTQVIMGDRVMVQEMRDGWYRIAAIDQPSPKDPQGYPGWIESSAVSPRVDEQGQMAIVIVPAAPVRTTASDDGPVLHTLSFDSRLTLKSANDAWVVVALPDGREGWVARDQVRLVCPDQGCAGDVAGEPDRPRPSHEIVDTAQQFMGTRYLWGGTSASAFDCSGFIYRVFHANGITVPRDSLPMSQSGAWVEREDLQPGDIIFTASGGPSGRVSHCALYLGDGQVLTTAGTDPITVVPLDSGRYRDEYWGARRYP